MNNETSEALYFRYCRNLEGDLEPIDIARQNGRPVPRFDQHLMSPGSEPAEDRSNWNELVEEVSINLTPIERRTWMRLLDGRTVLEVDDEDGVTRTAVYERIRGNGKGQGGMIRKNDYVAIW